MSKRELIEPNGDKRLALVLSAYPTKKSRIGNAVGLDGWVGPERGEEPDDHAIHERERYVRKLVAELLDG